MALPFYSSMAHAFWFFTHLLLSNDLFAFYFIWETMAKFGNGRVKYIFFKLTLFKLGCLCWSVWNAAFNDETFFLNQALKKYITIWIYIYRPTYGLSAFKYKELSVIVQNFHQCIPSCRLRKITEMNIPRVYSTIIRIVCEIQAEKTKHNPGYRFFTKKRCTKNSYIYIYIYICRWIKNKIKKEITQACKCVYLHYLP